MTNHATRQNPPSQADAELHRLAHHRRRAYFATVYGRVSARLNGNHVMPRPSTMSSRFYPEVSLIVASVPDDGMQVEVRAGSLDDPPLPDGTAPYIAAFRAEREGEIRMVFRVGSTNVEVPVEEIERAITFARQEVHAESFYPYPDEPDSAA